jgi:hypothetical protein
VKPLYEPEQVIDVLFDLATHPRDEVTVGPMGATFGALSERLMPNITETMMEKNVASTIENAKPAEDTAGALRQPMAEGTAVDGGWKERQKS